MFSEEEHERKICHLVGYCSHYSWIFIAFPFAVLLFSYFIFYLVKARALRCGQTFDILFNSPLNISSLSRSCVFLFFFIYSFFSLDFLLSWHQIQNKNADRRCSDESGFCIIITYWCKDHLYNYAHYVE